MFYYKAQFNLRVQYKRRRGPDKFCNASMQRSAENTVGLFVNELLSRVYFPLSGKGVVVGVRQNEGSNTTSLSGELMALAFEVLETSSLNPSWDSVYISSVVSHGRQMARVCVHRQVTFSSTTALCTTRSTHGTLGLPRNGMPKGSYHGSKFTMPTSRSGSGPL